MPGGGGILSLQLRIYHPEEPHHLGLNLGLRPVRHRVPTFTFSSPGTSRALVSSSACCPLWQQAGVHGHVHVQVRECSWGNRPSLVPAEAD